jgi:hypothetical protein
MPATNAKIGTTTRVTTRFRKAGVVCRYDVYEAACGGIFTARLTQYGSVATPEATWCEPQDTREAAIRAAYAEWQKPLADAREREQEYVAQGGY